MSIPPVISYRESTSFNQRKNKSLLLLERFEGRVPIILEKSNKDSVLPFPTKYKYIISLDMTIANVLNILKKNLNINETISIYLMCKDHNIMLSGSQSIEYIYNNYKNEDGFLYLTYCSENVFG